LNNLTTKEKVRFNELRKLMAGISNTVLSNRLLELEREDLISKKIHPEIHGSNLLLMKGAGIP
jgi:DNA-binding HxlR family transcriptional regulator